MNIGGPVTLLIILLMVACSRPKRNDTAINTTNTDRIVQSALMDGDIIFHESESDQSEAIKLATRSRYSHCGLIFKDKGKFYVLEAVGRVKRTPLDEWIARGRSGHYVVKRLKGAEQLLTPAVLKKMKAVGIGLVGKPYDFAFEWSDGKIYCSELVWKIYHRATGLQIGQLQTLGDFDLSSRAVRAIVQRRYGNNIPFNETVVSPASIFESDRLVTIKEFN